MNLKLKGQVSAQKGKLGFSLADLAAQQTLDVESKNLDTNSRDVLRERSSNIPSTESHLTSELSKLKLSIGKQEFKRSAVTSKLTDSMEKSMGMEQHISKPTGLNVPTKPPSFSLADLAKEHSSSPPSSFSKISSTPPRQQIINPSMTGLSLAQLAQQQSGSSPSHSVIQQGKDSNHSKTIGLGFNLAAPEQNHSDESGHKKAASHPENKHVLSISSLNKSELTRAVIYSTKSHQRPKTFNLSALAVQHEQRTKGIHCVPEENKGTKHIDKQPLPPPGFKPKQKVDLSALAAQHKMPESSQNVQVPKKEISKKVKSANEVLTTKPSIFGHALCSNYASVKLETKSSASKGLSYPKFSFIRQISKGSNSPTLDTRPVVPFDFSTPSPDDIVLKKQQSAFTRTGTRSIRSIQECIAR